MDDNSESRIDALLEQAVADHLAGQTPDIEAIAARHPELSTAIRERWQALLGLRDPLGSLMDTGQDHAGLPPGKSVGGYAITREIGRGGMGIVYEAEQSDPRRPVALKIMRGGPFVDEYSVRMFRREAEALARLKHPGIAAIYGAGRTEEGHHYFAMELVQGSPLTDYAGRGQLRIEEKLRLFQKVCEAVNYAHQRGVIHRDLKPGNILVEPQGQPKVLDFGLARLADIAPELTTHHTEAGRIAGTLAYMSPEQVRGNADEIDIRADVYALGVILYEMLTGRLPHEVTGQALPEALRQVCEDEPARPSTIHRPLRGDLETIILKALAKDRGRRYQSAHALSDDIERFLTNQPILARPPSAVYQLRKFVARHKVGAVLGTSLICCLSALGIVMSVMSVKLAHERDQAEQARILAMAAEERAKGDRDAQARERERAEKAEQDAKTEAQTAKEVTDFLVGIFAVADPSVTRGKSITTREVLDIGAIRVLKEMDNRPVVQATLLNAIGYIYTNMGLYDRAEPLLEKALVLGEETLGEDHPDVAVSLNNLGILYDHQGKYERAEPLFRRALAIRENALGAEHQEVASSLNNLAELLRVQGRYEEAEPLLKRALAINENALGADHPSVASSLNNLAGLLDTQGKYDQAEPLYKRALAIKEKALGADHPAVATSLNNLGMLFDHQGKYNEAEQLYKRALAIYELSLGANHPEVATCLGNLAEIYCISGKYDQAKPLHERALAIRENVLGADHPDVATSLNNLAMLYYTKGEYAKAESLFKRSLAIYEKALGTEHSNVAMSLNNLAALYRTQGKYDEAEPLHKRALAIREKVLGADHPDVAMSLNNLAELHHTQGDYAKAEPLYKRSLAIDEKALGPDHPSVATDLSNLAGLYCAQGKYTEAELLYKRSLAIRNEAFGPDHPDSANSLRSLAALYVEQNNYGRAEPLYKRLLSIKEATLGSDDPDLVTILSTLYAVYAQQDKYAAAEKTQRRILAIREKSLGKNDPLIAQTCTELAALACDASEYQKAEKLCRRALRIYSSKLFFRDQVGIAAVQNVQGWIHLAKNEPAEAEPLLRKTLATWKKKQPQDWGTANTESLLGACLTTLGRFEEAEPLLVNSYPRIKADFGIRRRRGIEALQQIVRLYEAWGKPEKAAEFREMLRQARDSEPAPASQPAQE